MPFCLLVVLSYRWSLIELVGIPYRLETSLILMPSSVMEFNAFSNDKFVQVPIFFVCMFFPPTWSLLYVCGGNGSALAPLPSLQSPIAPPAPLPSQIPSPVSPRASTVAAPRLHCRRSAPPLSPLRASTVAAPRLHCRRSAPPLSPLRASTVAAPCCDCAFAVAGCRRSALRPPCMDVLRAYFQQIPYMPEVRDWQPAPAVPPDPVCE